MRSLYCKYSRISSLIQEDSYSWTYSTIVFIGVFTIFIYIFASQKHWSELSHLSSYSKI